ncbi:MAG TPA: hypothetical protein VE956_00050 [Nodularia sp. (in: cyanobacteria)]|nr:hypothetical protein [Nodularia sp. (in: cyanobacteria)]
MRTPEEQIKALKHEESVVIQAQEMPNNIKDIEESMEKEGKVLNWTTDFDSDGNAKSINLFLY